MARERKGGSSALGRHVLRSFACQSVPLLLVAVLLVLHRDGLRSVDLTGIPAAMGGIPAAHWIAALLLTGISFFAVGQYDVTLHRHFGTRADPRAARRAGMAAIAIGQATGLAPVTGALVRWRMLPGARPADAIRLTAGVTLSFLSGWAVVTAIAVVLVAPGGSVAARFSPAALMGLTAITGLAVWMLMRPADGASRWPNALTLWRILFYVALDTISAGLVLWLLLPPGTGLSPATLIPAYLLALGAGLILATPGGLGPFEVALALLLPQVPAETLLGAVLGYRMIYFALPALIALAALARGPARPRTAPIPWRSAEQAAQQGFAARAAAGARGEPLVMRQGAHGVMTGPCGSFWVTGRLPGMLVALDDPVGPHREARRGVAIARLAALLRDEGRDTARVPVLYKCGARSAVTARRCGFRVAPVAAEASLCPASFDSAGPDHAQLRRKLRRAARAGVTAAAAGPDLPTADMARVAADWRRAHGRERGFSMGRFDAAYVAGQRVFLARVENEIVAFVTFHDCAGEWTLDLMRHRSGLPDGTMHALVVCAIDTARDMGVPRLSLAAVPLPPRMAANRVIRALHALSTRTGGGTGLAQFKSSFAPILTPRYIAAPSWFALLCATAAIARAIRAPGPLPCPRPASADAGIAGGTAGHRAGAGAGGDGGDRIPAGHNGRVRKRRPDAPIAA